MNRYSLSSDSDRWWLPSAIAGTIGAATVGAIIAVSVTGAQAVPDWTPTNDAALPAVPDSVVLVDRPCYLARKGWNTPAGWEQPVCSTQVRRGAEVPAIGARRPAPDYLP